ncbi:MAG: M20 family peptidase [Candidatus Binatia bacterium]
MNKLFGVLALVAAVLGGALLIGVQRFVPRQIDVAPATPMEIDVDAAAQRLSRAIRHRTVSPVDSASQAEFERFLAFLTESFPALHKRLARETVNQLSLLYTWQGTRTELKPILLLAHMDVVPADPASEKSWTYPPFSGQLADGYIWGRGAMDDKASVLGILEAVERLLSEGFHPTRTIYLAFGHDEEIGGANGAAKIAATLAARSVQLEYVLDEGMNILRGVIEGVNAPVALIGVAEKGYLSVELSANADGGHSSIPANDNAIGRISRALQRLDATPFPARLRGPTRAMFDYLGPEMGWTQKLLLANLWLFEPLIANRLSKSPLTNAILRTTLAPTIFSSGIKENVLPAQARAVINLRIMPGESTASALEHVRTSIDDPKIKLTPLPIRMEPSAVTDIGSQSFKLVERTIRQTAPEAIVAPALLVAATDSRHYAGLTKNVLRFLPITISAADTSRYHGIDERIALTDYLRCINFYAQLIRNSQA